MYTHLTNNRPSGTRCLTRPFPSPSELVDASLAVHQLVAGFQTGEGVLHACSVPGLYARVVPLHALEERVERALIVAPGSLGTVLPEPDIVTRRSASSRPCRRAPF